jgi:anthranilate phosphoribosyltransferase
MSERDALAAALGRLWDGNDLSAEEACAAVDVIMDGTAPPARVGAFLAALRVKGEAASEIVGAARAMRARCEPVRSTRSPLVDTCGTGGDGGRTFSVSTAAAFVAAGAGAAVAKHGNRAASGRFGGADVLEALGVDIEQSPEKAGRCLDEVGMAFLFAPRMHPAMRHAGPVRRDLGLPTIFNLLGPLTNPAGVRRQVIGVASLAALGLISQALVELGAEHALVVHGRDGLDEISLSAETDAVEVRNGEVRELVLDASSFALRPVPAAAIHARDLESSVAMVREVLAGAPTPGGEVVIANAAAALYVAGIAATLPDGAERARASIASGAARRVLEGLVEHSRRAPGEKP